MPRSPSQRPIGVREAVERLAVSEKTIRRAIADGTLPARRVGRKVIRVQVADLDRFAQPIPTAGDDDA
jgi:excisionase family DNA binding protein